VKYKKLLLTIFVLSFGQTTHAVWKEFTVAAVTSVVAVAAVAAPFTNALLTPYVEGSFLTAINVTTPTGLRLPSISVPQGCYAQIPSNIFNCIFSSTSFIAALGARAFEVLVANYTHEKAMPFVEINTRYANIEPGHNTELACYNSTCIMLSKNNNPPHLPIPECSDSTTIPICRSGVPECINPKNGRIKTIKPICTKPVDGSSIGTLECITPNVLVCNLNPAEISIQLPTYHAVKTVEGQKAIGQLIVISQALEQT